MANFLATLIQKPAEQVVIHYDIPYHAEEQQKQPSKIWNDHFASVAEYWNHKRRHPDTHAGALVVMYKWTPYVIAAVSILTVNPIGFAYSLSRILNAFDDRNDYLLKVYLSFQRRT